ncbi:MAG: hypothetical protein WKG06_17020 [Segetibacter sp.]
MIKFLILIAACLFVSCSASDKESPLVVKKELPKELKEISGMITSGSDIWAITDKPHATVYKLDLSGNLKEQVEITNAEATDVEAVTADADYIYIGDVGDNTGDRTERKIIKVAKANINQGTQAKVTGENIDFTFAEEEQVEKRSKIILIVSH